MLLATALVAALAAPGQPGATPIGASAAVASATGVPAPSLDHGERRPTRARAPIPPALRRLLRKRDVIPIEVPGGGREVRDATVSLLARSLCRGSASFLALCRGRPDGHRIRLRLALSGFHTDALRTPPPTLPA